MSVELGDIPKSKETIIITPESEIRAKNDRLQIVLKKLADFVNGTGIDLDPFREVNANVANAVKSNVDVDGFKTVIYGLGGPDILGAAEFLLSSGGNIVSFCNEDILDTHAAIALLNIPAWELIAKETFMDYAKMGYYYPSKDSLKPVPGTGTFALAVNLVAAGVSPEHVQLIEEQTVRLQEHQIIIDTVQIRRGEQVITDFIVFPVNFTMPRMEIGVNTEDIQLQVVGALLENFDGDQPTVALSKASYMMGISYIAPLLQPGTTLVYDESAEEGDIERRLVKISKPKTLVESIVLPSEYDDNIINAPSWGYRRNPRYVRYATVIDSPAQQE